MVYEFWPQFGMLDNTYTPPNQPSWLCNCACSICMAGQCCMDPNRWTPPTQVSTGTAIVVGLHEHSWQALGFTEDHEDGLYVIQSCSCGDVRRVPVPA